MLTKMQMQLIHFVPGPMSLSFCAEVSSNDDFFRTPESLRIDAISLATVVLPVPCKNDQLFLQLPEITEIFWGVKAMKYDHDPTQ